MDLTWESAAEMEMRDLRIRDYAVGQIGSPRAFGPTSVHFWFSPTDVSNQFLFIAQLELLFCPPYPFTWCKKLFTNNDKWSPGLKLTTALEVLKD